MCKKPGKKVHCFVCDSVFSTKSKMLKHVSDMHQVSDDIYTPINCSTGPYKTNNGVFVYSHDLKNISLVIANNESSEKQHSLLASDYSSNQINKKYELQNELLKRTNIKSNGCNQSKIKSMKCVMCEHRCMTKQIMLAHYKSDHGIKIEIETIRFINFSNFLKWKADLEQNTTTKFVKFRNKFFKNTTQHFYKCHRDGNFKKSGNYLRKLKAKGSNKIDGYCPAKIEVCRYTSKDEVVVKFLKTHAGHTMDIERINLSEEERRLIATKLCDEAPNKNILNNIQNIDNDKLKRLKFVTMKDLHNINKSHSLLASYGPKSLKLDSFRAPNCIEDMQTPCNNSAIRFFKPIGTIMENYPLLANDDFLLLVATDTQLNNLKQFGNDIICIDIHHCDDHEFDLILLSVIDEKKHCFPCGFIFCNAADTNIYKLSFETLKNCIGFSHRSRVIMTNAIDIYHTWCSVMSHVSVHLCSLWKLKNEWKTNIDSKIHSLIKQQLVSDTLKILIEKKNCSEFEKILNEVSHSLLRDFELEEFGHYFEKFKYNKNSWAQCYRDHSDNEANILFERLHYSVKLLYSQECKLVNINNMVALLINFMEQKFLENGYNINIIMKRHENYLKSGATLKISSDGDDSWTVMCSVKKLSYKVTKWNLICACKKRCYVCDYCVHAYVCSCDDSYLKWNMCLHIHLICQLSQQSNNKEFSYTIANDSSVLNSSSVNSVKEPEVSFIENLDEKKLRLVEKFKKIVESTRTPGELKALEDFLSPVISKLELIKQQQ